MSTCLCNSAIFTVNQSSVAINDNAVIPLGTTNRRFGKNIRQAGDGIIISGVGYYEVNAAFTITATAAGDLTIEMLENGVPVQGATATATFTAAGTATLPINAITRITNCDTANTITFRITGGAATLTNASVIVTKI